MKPLKNTLILLFAGCLIWACGSSSIKTKNATKEQPVVIANDSLKYKITIIDLGFTSYLNSIAKPIEFYSQNYLELKNQFYVLAWNYRVRSPFQFDPNIYENIINYDSSINYGLEVNYKLFNYFEFAQRKYRMVLR